MWPCGIVVMFAELFTAESKSQVYAALHQLLSNHKTVSSRLSKQILDAHCAIGLINYHLILEFICYDDGCHLRKYANNVTRREFSEASKKLASTEIVIDKMHMAGHTDKWCHRNCNPRAFKELDDVSYSR